MRKTCGKCKVEQPISNFFRNKRSKDGLRWDCKSCNSTYTNSCYKTNLSFREKAKARAKTYYSNNKEQVIKRLHGDRIVRKDRILKHKYGVGIEVYNTMLKNQDFRCKVCNVESSKGNRSLCIDHNHTTGKVRGLLCHNCNVALGLVREKIEVLNGLIKYLEEFNELV